MTGGKTRTSGRGSTHRASCLNLSPVQAPIRRRSTRFPKDRRPGREPAGGRPGNGRGREPDRVVLRGHFRVAEEAPPCGQTRGQRGRGITGRHRRTSGLGTPVRVRGRHGVARIRGRQPAPVPDDAKVPSREDRGEVVKSRGNGLPRGEPVGRQPASAAYGLNPEDLLPRTLRVEPERHGGQGVGVAPQPEEYPRYPVAREPDMAGVASVVLSTSMAADKEVARHNNDQRTAVDRVMMRGGFGC